MRGVYSRGGNESSQSHRGIKVGATDGTTDEDSSFDALPALSAAS